PLGFHLILLTAKRAKSLFTRAGDYRALYRTELPCAGGVRVTPAGRSDTAYRLLVHCTLFSVARPRPSTVAQFLLKTP
ncbi:hypothetical protein, partial [uncultured Rikenella sp.]|uniref:hypothetical protein n=1 Tax=uncultured Rikenella sp. TaxID=368003 RepID=UPI0026311119